MPDRLHVYLGGTHVADIERRRRSDARLHLRYTREALDSWPLNAPVISCSLPLSTRPIHANAFLRGLLPEGAALAAAAARAGTTTADTFDLLHRYGRDVAGALVIAEDTPDESRWAAESYDLVSLGDEVASLDDNPLGIHDDSELSLPGLQNKLLLVQTEEGWARPLYGRPSTHILKAEDRRFPGLADAEAECLALARAVGLTPVEAHVETLANIPCLITERYDRRVDGGTIERIHQEDLCQAVGIDGAGNRGRAKYQRQGGGGPGWRQAAALLDAHAGDAPFELARLVRALVFTIAIGNADGHAKNLSLLHPTPTTVSLAPLYDTTPTLLWPSLTTESALCVNARYSLADLTVDDVVAEAASWPFDRTQTERVAIETLELTLAAAEARGSGEVSSLVVSRCRALLAGRPAGRVRR
jgi:serine/threonine-protein kinase HipA